MKQITEPKVANANDNSTLTRCLLEGDSAAESSHQRSRRKALGLSLAIEAVMLGLLIISRC